MKKIVIALFTCISLNANAGLMDQVKIKKAVRSGDTKVSAELANVKKACGNKNLTISVDWDKWNSYKLDAAKHETTINYVVGLIVNDVLGNMIEACKDADYKSAITATKKINVSGKDKFSDRYIDFEYLNGTLKATVNADGYRSSKNKELFMAIW